jgi:GNAT superfamily N-acetyltransferase
MRAATSSADIVELDVEAYASAIPELGSLLVDAVDSGAAVNFVRGLDQARAQAWWRDRMDAVALGEVVPFVARLDGGIVGVTLLMPSTKENSPHRGEIGKVIVHRSARRQGIARQLLLAAEEAAADRGLTLLVLDTESGSDAERLYRDCGWQQTGQVPGYALNVDGVPTPATFFWKELR